MSTDLPGLGSNRMQAMVYGYDQLHRIVQARSLTEYEAIGYKTRVPGPKAYDVDYSYDPNGNLLTLQRLDDQTDIQGDLTYEYYELTNRLKNVDGSVDQNYRYDEIEGRALRIFPVERFSEEPGCRGGLQMWKKVSTALPGRLMGKSGRCLRMTIPRFISGTMPLRTER